MTPKVTFLLIVFNGNFFLEPMLKSLTKYGRVVCAEGPVAYFRERGYKTSGDGTNEILAQMLPAGDVVHGQWAEKDEQANAALALVNPDTSHIFCVDADEIWDFWAIKKIFGLLETEQYDSMAFRFNTFYGGFERVMRGFEHNFENHRIQRYYPGCRFETHRPPTILAPDGRPWREHKHLNHIATSALGIEIAHYSYVFPTQVKEKIAYYSSWGAGTIGDYFHRVYAPWVLGDAARKREIENAFDGVHEWLPSRRGDARTVPFVGEHPRHIDRMLPALKRRLAWEIAEMKAGRI